MGVNSHMSKKEENILKFKKLAMDIVVISFGLMISSFGISLFYQASLGSSPMATFGDGIHNLLGIKYGTANMVLNSILLIVLYFTKKEYINIGTILCVFTIGIYVNFFTDYLQILSISTLSIYMRLLSVIVGTILMGVGLGLYVAVNRGFGPLEALVVMFCNKTGQSYRVIKIVQDFILVLGGVLLKAKWGVGTVIALLLTGPVLQFSIDLFKSKFYKST